MEGPSKSSGILSYIVTLPFRKGFFLFSKWLPRSFYLGWERWYVWQIADLQTVLNFILYPFNDLDGSPHHPEIFILSR